LKGGTGRQRRARRLNPWTAVVVLFAAMDYRKIITVEPGKRGGKPCVRGLRITVGDVFGWIAAGMSWREILDDYPDLTELDLRACFAYAAAREQHTMIALTPHEAAVRP